MSDQVSWHVELTVRPGKLADFQTLTDEMVTAAEAEEGVLAFERFVSDDGSRVHVYDMFPIRQG